VSTTGNGTNGKGNGNGAPRRRRLSKQDLAPPDPGLLDIEVSDVATPVEFGSVSDVAEVGSEALAEYAATGAVGIPTTDFADHGASAEAEHARGWRRVVAGIKSYGVLRHTPYGILPVFILGFILLFETFDSNTFLLAGPNISRDLEIDVGQIINILFAVSLVATIVGVGIGWLADRTKRLPLVGYGAIISGICASLSGFGRSTFTLGAPRALDDGIDTGSYGIRFALLSDYYPPETRGRAFALGTSIYQFGVLTVPAAGGAMVSTLGWRTTMRILGIPLVLLGIFTLAKLREPVKGFMERKALGADDDVALQEEEPQSFSEAWRTTWSVRTLRRFFIGDVAAGAQERFIVFFIPFFLADKYGLNALKIGLFLSGPAIFGIVGGLIGGSLIDRFLVQNPRRVPILYGAAQVLLAFTYIGFAVQPPLWVLGLIYVLGRMVSGLVGPAVKLIYAQVLPPKIKTQGFQITQLATVPGYLVLAGVAGALFFHHGFGAVFMASVPFGVLAGILYATASPFFDIDARTASAAAMADEEWRRAKAAGRGKMLVIRDVDVEYDGVQVLFGVDADIEEGEIVALLGTNGAGKSTLLRAISGTQQASAGAIVFDGRDITHMPPHEVAARGITHMPGGRGIFPELTVRDNLLAATWLSTDAAQAREQLAEVFDIFPVLRERADVDAGLLSGGEQQQLSLAQAFLSKPRVLLIDELSLGLSPNVVAQLLDIVREIHKRGVTIVIVEQSVNVALTIADKAIFMEKGEVKFFGRTRDLLERPDILRAVYVKGTAGVPSAGGRRRAVALEGQIALRVEGLEKRYGGVTAVDDVSFDLRVGEVLGLIGPNGAGKTSLFDLISGFQLPDGGTVNFLGTDITNLSPEERARLGLVRRFQDAKLFPALTVFETMLVALDHRLEVRSSLMSAAGLPQVRRAERRLKARAENLIELLELGAYRDKFVKELSTGLRRIVDLAAVFATEPKVLLLDEPSSGIAQAEAENLAPLLRRVRHETGCSILIIEHDMPLISAVADELLALDQGHTVVRGTPAVVLDDERVITSYLGTSVAAIQRTGR
jgi:branched-chain amino acid transport system ATP-binding protein